VVLFGYDRKVVMSRNRRLCTVGQVLGLRSERIDRLMHVTVTFKDTGPLFAPVPVSQFSISSKKFL
jgi:hypothetical protein